MEVSEIDVGEIEISKIEIDEVAISDKKMVSVLLNILNLDFDYSNLDKIDNIYIPLKYFLNNKYSEILFILQQKFKLYIYMPTIIKDTYSNLFYTRNYGGIDTR